MPEVGWWSAAVALVVSSCASPCEPWLVITSLADGATLDARADVDPSIAGVQTDVEVEASCTAAGEEIDLILAGDSIIGTAWVDVEGRATFRSVTVPPGTHTLMAVMRVSGVRSEPLTLEVLGP